MSHYDLIDIDMQKNLMQDLQEMDLSICSNAELVALRSWVVRVKAQADLRTLEDELVGYTYHNLAIINPKLANEAAKRGIQLVKAS